MCVTRGALHWSARTLALQAILKDGLTFSFVRGARVCQISDSASGTGTLASRQSAVACRSQHSSGVFFFMSASGTACCSWCTM